jgi:hypothetical protein
VYAYHALSRGWGDIGYNYLLDTDGHMFEGRAGGGNVVGGHALLFNWGSIGIGNLGTFSDPNEYPGGMRPTSRQLQAIEAFIARRSFDRDIDPAGHGEFWNHDIPNVIGHRDANGRCEGCSTSCPGNYLYHSLPVIRREAAAVRRPARAVMWLSHNVQGDYYTRQRTADVKIFARNTGARPWATGGNNAMEIVATWQTLRGDDYTDDGNLTSRAAVPHEVKPGGDVYLPLTLRLPRKVGKYHLRITMQAKGERSLFDQGHASYDLRVNVQSQVPFDVPDALRVLVEAGETVDTTVAIGGDGQPWTATSNHPAVRCIPDGGSAPGRTTIRCDATDLDPGSYDATVTFTHVDAVGNSGTKTLAVHLVVREKVQRTFFPAIRS